jgi:hypothetical protein
VVLFEFLIALLVALGAAVLTAEEAAARLLSAGRVHRLAETDRPGARRLAELTSPASAPRPPSLARSRSGSPVSWDSSSRHSC